MELPADQQQIKRPFYRKLLRFCAWLVALVCLVTAGLSALLYFYRDDVKAAVLREINRHLKAEVRIDPANIDITILSTFPDCSVEFRELLMLEALPRKKRDTLLFAGRLNLHFNIKDLWNKKYTIQKISLAEGMAKPRILRDGTNNYTFWEQSGSSSGQVSFKLKMVNIRSFAVQYQDQPAGLRTAFVINGTTFRGDFSGERYDLSAKGSLLLQEIVSGKNHFLRQKTLVYDAGLLVNGANYSFRKSSITLGQLRMYLEGSFVYREALDNLDLRYQADDLDIASLMSLLPEAYKEKINNYESEGNFYAKGRLVYKGRKAYSLNSKFGVQQGQITYKPGNTSAEGLSLEGSLQMSESSSLLRLKNIRLSLRNDTVSGDLLLKDFSDPHLELDLRAGLHLENLQAFWPIDTLTSLKGRIGIQGSLRSKVSALKTATFSDKVMIELLAVVSGIEAGFKHDPRLYRVAHCRLEAKDRNIEVKDLVMNRGASELRLNGRMPGIFNYLFDRKAPLVIEGTLESPQFNMEDFIGERQASGGQTAGALIPANVLFRLQTAIGSFSFGKFKAAGIKGEIEIKNQKAIVSDISFSALGGDVEMDAFADNSGKKLEVMIQGKLKQIDISRLFREMNNFGQSTLDERHVKGLLTADIDFSGNWDNNLVSDESSLRASCNLLVERGELVEFKPLLSLSRFVNVDDLKRIRFSTLQSEIRIADRMIVIPRTSVKNSALNLELWGKHSFDNRIDYHFRLLLSELLAKRRKKTDDEFGPVENDPENRRSAFILMSGTVDKPEISYDKQGFRDKVKQDIRQEKQNLRQIIREEISTIKNEPAERAPREPARALEIERPEAKPAPKKTLELKKKEDDEDF